RSRPRTNGSRRSSQKCPASGKPLRNSCGASADEGRHQSCHRHVLPLHRFRHRLPRGDPAFRRVLDVTRSTATDGSIWSPDMIEREDDPATGICNGVGLSLLYFWLPLAVLLVLL